MFRLVLCLVVFWNVENYFDPFDDPLTRDESFTPQGYFAWTWNRFIKKRNDLAKTIIACGLQDDGTWEAPCIVGLCEIENFFVLYQLVTDSPGAFGVRHHPPRLSRPARHRCGAAVQKVVVPPFESGFLFAEAGPGWCICTGCLARARWCITHTGQCLRVGYFVCYGCLCVRTECFA